MSLRISTPAVEGTYQASKFLKFQVLCDREDLQDLFEKIGPVFLYLLGGVGSGEPLAKEQFLEEYGRWVEGLKCGVLPKDAELKKILACAWTRDESLLWKQEVAGGKFLVKMGGPVVQVQAHSFTWSEIDGVFRPMTMGLNAIFWGLQFSFPQIYQHPKTMEFLEPEGPNVEMFKILRQWVRDRTVPTPFVVNGEKINSPIRIGKTCFEWIQKHPQLTKVRVYG